MKFKYQNLGSLRQKKYLKSMAVSLGHHKHFKLVFITATRITEDADYKGVRILLRGNLGSIRLFLQIDIGFGDVVIPSPGEINYPVLLDFPPPKLDGYTMESTVAEKFQAIIFNKDNFLPVFNQDIVTAKKEILIVSPFARQRRTYQMIQTLQAAIKISMAPSLPVR